MRVLFLLAAASTLGGFATAGDESWVREHIAVAPGIEQALDLAVHPSGDVTVVGSSSGELALLRLGPGGEERWLRFEAGEAPGSRVSITRAVEAGEDVLVATSFDGLDYELETRIARYDSTGTRLWSGRYGWSASVAAAEPDRGGGVIVSGERFDPDYASYYGYVERIASDGGLAWFRRQGSPLDSGRLGPLATDSEGNVYAGGQAEDGAGARAVLYKYAAGGRPEWEVVIAAGRAVSDLALAGDGSSCTLTGPGAAGGIWTARVAVDGVRLWFRPPHAIESSPTVAVGSDGTSYVAAGAAGGDIIVHAYDEGGVLRWERLYDSALGADVPTAVEVTPDGRIFVLGAAGGALLLLELDAGGELLRADRYPGGPAVGLVLATAPSARAVAAGWTGEYPDLDFLALEAEPAGGLRVLSRWGRTTAARSTEARSVGLAPDGGVVAAFESSYGAGLRSFDLVAYHADGSDAWTRIEPGLLGAAAGHDRDGSTYVAGYHRGNEGRVLRVDPDGTVAWSRDFGGYERFEDVALLVSPDGDLVLVGKAEDATPVLALDRDGGERWRRTVSDAVATGAALAPDGRVFVLMRDGRVYDLSGDGTEERTWRYDDALPVFGAASMVPGLEPGVLYLGGTSRGGQHLHWTVARFGPGGELDWVHVEPSPDPGGFVTHLAAYPDGGVIAAGVIDERTWTARYSPEGTVLWREHSTTGHADFPADVAVDPAGNVLVVLADQATGETHTLKYGSGGELVSDRSHAGSTAEGARRLATGADLSVAVAGPAVGGAGFVLEYAEPYPVEITSLVAERTGSDVRVEWALGIAEEPLGFNLLHAAASEGAYAAVNATPLDPGARSFVHRGAPAAGVYYVLEVLARGGSVARHGPVAVSPAPAPAVLSLSPPHPNPGAGEIEWRLGLPAAGRVRLTVHDAAGRRAASVLDAVLPAGLHRIAWNAGGVPRGVYFYRLETSRGTRTGKLILARAPREVNLRSGM